jgi:GNAT superfamily N-acetyltransferase
MIRLAQPDDVPRVHELIMALAVYERLEHKATGTPEMLREQLFGPERFLETLVVEEDGELVGFALFYRNYSTFLAKPGFWLEDLFVEPGHRGKGYGKALLTEIAKMAIGKGFGRVDWAVLDWNEPSIAFYESIGAVPMSDWITYRLEGESLFNTANPDAPHRKTKTELEVS